MIACPLAVSGGAAHECPHPSLMLSWYTSGLLTRHRFCLVRICRLATVLLMCHGHAQPRCILCAGANGCYACFLVLFYMASPLLAGRPRLCSLSLSLAVCLHDVSFTAFTHPHVRSRARPTPFSLPHSLQPLSNLTRARYGGRGNQAVALSFLPSTRIGPKTWTCDPSSVATHAYALTKASRV